MGSNAASTGGRGGGVGPAGRTPEGNLGTEQDAKKASSRNKLRKFVTEGGVTGAVIKLFNTEEENREFYETKVRPAGISKAPDYETYMTDRLAGKTDAYGNVNPNYDKGSNGGNKIKSEAIAQAPTTAEVSQSAATDATSLDSATTMTDTSILKKKRTNAKGRSTTILTSSAGLKDTNLKLGTASLLGR